MTITIPRTNWTMALADAIRDACDGDVIVVHNDDMRELGERAKGRMCPNKTLTFQVEDE